MVYEIPNIVENENLIVAPCQGKTPVAIANDEFCEELAFPYLFPSGKFGYKVKRESALFPVKYFNQRLLSFKQNFTSDADYIFFARSVVEQHHQNREQHHSQHLEQHHSQIKIHILKLSHCV